MDKREDPWGPDWSGELSDKNLVESLAEFEWFVRESFSPRVTFGTCRLQMGGVRNSV